MQYTCADNVIMTEKDRELQRKTSRGQKRKECRHATQEDRADCIDSAIVQRKEQPSE